MWLLFLILLFRGVTFAPGSVLVSNLAQSVLQPSSNVIYAQASAPLAPPALTIFGLDRVTALLAGVTLILLILYALLLLFKVRTWRTA